MYKDELASGKVPLPPIYLGGTLFPPNSMVSRPSLDLELMIKEINVDLTTDVLNQLLVVQIAFIKVRNVGEFLQRKMCQSDVPENAENNAS